MSGITTHVLDTSLGRPGVGIEISLEYKNGDNFEKIGGGITNDDGRLPGLLGDDYQLKKGTYRINFDVEAYYEKSGKDSFYPEASITFYVKEPTEHYHVPLLISGFGFSTYRGS